ncbi:MAG: GNAT family N-acetyltransferase [Actinomycetota bacterium]|nr:GNAT family N-acetyltransferase [Actinomycetota bacterium]
MNEEFVRTLEFEKDIARAASTLVRDVGVGTLYVNSDLPGVWDRNFLRLDERASAHTAEYLDGLVEELLGAVGAKHRKIYVAEDHVTPEMLAGFTSFGWERSLLATMAHRNRGFRSDLQVNEVDADAYAPFERKCLDESPPSDVSVKEQIVSLVPLMHRAARGRFFVVSEEGEMVAGCHLYSDGEVAQVENVTTLETYRGRGLASAVVARAVDEAIAEGNSLTFLLVDDGGGPKTLYERIGFETIGRTVELFREPPNEAAS